jgi:uncharacterized protein (TIGR00369 family)
VVGFLTQLREARASGDPDRILQAIPYSRFIGVRAITAQDGTPVCELPFAPRIVGNPTLPAIHGGVIGALLEGAAILALLLEVDVAQVPKTINITVDYLLSGRGRTTYAQGQVFRQGRRVATVRAEAWQDDRAKPIATANAHFLLV